MKVGESRVYVVPLRRKTETVPTWRRTKKSMKVLKEFILKHTKADKVNVSRWVNELIWGKGGKNIIPRITVKVSLKEEDKVKVAHVDLDVLPSRAKRVEKKVSEKKTLREKIKAKFAKKEDEETKEEVKEEKEQAKMTKEQELAMSKSQA